MGHRVLFVYRLALPCKSWTEKTLKAHQTARVKDLSWRQVRPSIVYSPFCRHSGHFDFYCFKRHYGMLWGQMNMYLPPEHPIIAIWNNRNQNRHRICKTVYFETSRVAFMPNITYNSCYYLFILQPEKFSHLTPCVYFRGVVSLRRRVNWFRSCFFRPSWSIVSTNYGWSRHSNNHSNHVISHLSDWLYQVHKAKPKHFR